MRTKEMLHAIRSMDGQHAGAMAAHPHPRVHGRVGFTETTTTGYIVGTIGVFPMLGGLYDVCIRRVDLLGSFS